MTSQVRPLRADAARNRELLLAAAEREFAANGLDVSVADIAARAGVGKGTFFRHFATKAELIVAIVGDDVLALDAVGQGLLAASDPGDALLEFLMAASARRQQRDVSFLMRASESNPDIAEIRDQLFETVGTLVARAQEGGAVRKDVTGADVILLMCAPIHVVEYLRDAAPDLWKRYLAVIFDGLRPAGAHPLPVPAPSSLD
jgi:AcrR family transcriptional regulator